MIRRLAPLVVLAGCDLVFPLHPPDEPQIASCTTPASAVADNFDDNVSFPLWREIESAGNPVIEGNGAIHVDMTMAGTSELRMEPFFDLRDASFSIRPSIGSALGAGSAITYELEAVDNFVRGLGHTLRMAVFGGELHVEYTENNATSELTSVPYVPDMQQVWKIAQDGPTTKWSTSIDGMVFTPLFDIDLTFPIAFVRPRLSASSSGQSFASAFASLNNGAAPDSVCPADELRDNFSTFDPLLWGRGGQFGCSIGIEDGQLALSGAGLFGCDVGSSGPYDLVDHTFAVSTDVTLDGLCKARLEVQTIDGGVARFEVSGGMLLATTVLVGELETMREMVTYEPATHRFWRFTGGIGGSGGELTWETSPDGIDYTMLIKVGGLVDLGRAQFSFHLEGLANAGACSARFDDVNL